MQYLLLIYVNEKEFDGQPQDKLKATYNEYNKLRDEDSSRRSRSSAAAACSP